MAAGLVRIDGPHATLLLDARGDAAPRLAYLGPRLPPDADLAAVAGATAVGRRESRPDEDPGLTILPETGWGFAGEPAVVVEAGDRPARFELAGIAAADGGIEIALTDPVLRLDLRLRWRFEPSGLLAADARLTNRGAAAVRLHWLAALALPLPRWATEATQVHGRWGGEFALARAPLVTGRIEKTNRTGRTGFDGAAYLLVHDRGASDERGRVAAAHLAWSGNARSFVETLPDGERQLQIGEWLAPGEAVLEPGESHATPTALAAISFEGLNGVRRAFHAELRRQSAGVRHGPRRVHFNSWEAVYFDLSEPALSELVDAAADLGVERFVLDDGWFRGRRDDSTSLGDWTVDEGVFPNGLGPLIARVRSRGMDFGLWVEPEMVSPNSELYRARPDWCLHAADRERPTQRRQLVLDLSRADVRDHLFGRLDALLVTDEIAYLKWDHNRDLFPVRSARAQTIGSYALLDRVRAAHPRVEIESCASGGARVDFEVMRRAARAWASDNTDAIERLRLHRAMSLFYPPEAIGAHVGSAPNPTTGRRLRMDFRARVAMFAHLGVEADPRRMNEAERATLRAHIDLYKRFRALIHDGVQRFADADDAGLTLQTIVARDGGEALALVARTDQAEAAASGAVRLPGLDPAASYRLTLLEPWPARAARQLGDAAFWKARPVIDGSTLALAGLRLPVVHPETAWLVHLERV